MKTFAKLAGISSTTGVNRSRKTFYASIDHARFVAVNMTSSCFFGVAHTAFQTVWHYC